MERAVIITGASGGIGTALCDTFVEAGYFVIAIDRQPPAAASTSQVFRPIDLDRYCTDAAFRAAATSDLHSTLSERKLAAVINNAAIQIVKPTESLSAADWTQTLNVNVSAPFFLIQALLPQLEAAKGSIVNIASIHATLTKPGFVAYATSKAALVGLTRSLAVDLGGRVRVNAICPAAIATPMLREGFNDRGDKIQRLAQMHPLGRIGAPAEVARMALFLVSDDASFVSGSAFQLDGGIGARLHDPV
jgi:NAD(P)-dependent dehydrogenase (short-subunit alcohol dehydrogenase family)